MRYTVVISQEDNAFVVRGPALPGCFTQGGTADEALLRAKEAIAGHVAALRDLGEPVPIEADPLIVASVDAAPAA
jgi:predicted RNase H-like HicB family nuclease